MKIRNGFVSNSSSSSFLVAFKPEEIKTVDALNETLFGEDEIHEGYDTYKITETVWNDIQKQKNITNGIEFNEVVLACIEVGGDPELIMKKFYSHISRDDNWEKYWEIYDVIEAMQSGDTRDMELLKKENPGCELYAFTYADEDGAYFSMMEHSGIFEGIPHIRNSNH